MKTKIDILLKKLKIEVDSAAHLEETSTTDWQFIDVYIKIMTPVATALDRLQGEQNACQGYIIPTLLSMRYKIHDVNGRKLIQKKRDTMLT